MRPLIHAARLLSRRTTHTFLVALPLVLAGCGSLVAPADDVVWVVPPIEPQNAAAIEAYPMPEAIERIEQAGRDASASPTQARAPRPPSRTPPRTSPGRDGPSTTDPAALAGVPDATPKDEPLHRFANRPYTVLGRPHQPDTARRPIVQTGRASWYGSLFHGRKTSIGEVFDMHTMTAAHPTMALPSYARVTSLGTGKSVVVRVNDRGPFVGDRIIDLSYAAAVRLGFAAQGTTTVRVESISITPGINDALAQATPAAKPAPANGSAAAVAIAGAAAAATTSPGIASPGTPRPLAAAAAIQSAEAASTATPAGAAFSAIRAAGGIFVQIGVFRQESNATRIGERIASLLPALQRSVAIIARPDGQFQVQAGPYTDRKQAGTVADDLRRELQLRPQLLHRKAAQ